VTDPTTVLAEAAAVVDPKGENEDVSLLCGLFAWALEHPDDYAGWDADTLRRAVGWTFGLDPDDAAAFARELAPT
jgi:hypothetical protein